MAIGIFLIITLLLTFIVYIEVRKFFVDRKLQNFDLVKGAPFIGVIGRILVTTNFDIIGLISKTFDEAKTTAFRLWIGPVLVLGVYDPTSAEILLTRDNSLDKPFFYDYFNCKTCLISVDKEIWKSNRRALNSAFTVTAINSYMPHFNEKSHIMIGRMRPYLNEAGDIYRFISVCIMDMTIRTMFGVNMNFQESELGDHFYEIEKKIVNAIQFRIPRIWLRYDFIYHNFSAVGRDERCLVKYVKNSVKDLYDQRVKELYVHGVDERSAYGFLEKCLQLERQGIFNRQSVLDELSAMLVAGNDTPSITIFGTLLMLAINQQHQELVVDELHSIFDSADSDVTQTHLAAMNYTERVIKESMRLLTPVPFLTRRTNADIDLPNGTVPKDTIVIVSAMHLHRNPQIWGEDVLNFDPDRFLPQNIEKRPPFSYIPFSAGPRNCIAIKYGMILTKIILAHLLRQYKFTTDLKFDDVKLFMHLVLGIANDKPLKIEKRAF